MEPLCFDLYCGLGGWAEGFLSEGYRVIGFDIERHDYGTGGYPGELVLRDVRSIHGAELIREYGIPAVIVGSSPCQEFSYRAMPWKRAKALPPPYLGIELFQAQFRIQREASEAAGRYIPMVVENVRGAQKWVGRAQAEYGSYMLWGDVRQVGRKIVRPDYSYGDTQYLIAPPPRSYLKQPGRNFHFLEKFGIPSPSFHGHEGESSILAAAELSGRKGPGGDWFEDGRQGQDACAEAVKIRGISFSGYGKPGYKPQGFNLTAAQRYREGQKAVQDSLGGYGGNFGWDNTPLRRGNSHSDSRKAASALIAKIPFPLAQHIARCFKPVTESA